jgi:hypothetical protein
MMRHILEYNKYESNSSDHLQWGDQIKRWTNLTLKDKKLKDGYELKSVEILNPTSSHYSTAIGGESGQGIIELNFKKPVPSELDQLISDLSDVGLAEDKKIEINYYIEVDPNLGDELYSVLIRLTPKQIPNFMGMTFKAFADNHYDMSYGVGKTIAEEIKSQVI